MVTDNPVSGRRQAIETAIASELARQGADGVDVSALSDVVEAALGAQLPVTEGKRPEDLNATNDD